VAHKTLSDNFEEIYLLRSRLSTSLTKESEAFIAKTETVKIIKHSISVFMRKHYRSMSNVGLESGDIYSISSCFAAVFFSKYHGKFPNNKAANYSLMRFIGQNLTRMIDKYKRKMQISGGIDVSQVDWDLFKENDCFTKDKAGYIESQEKKERDSDKLDSNFSKLKKKPKKKLYWVFTRSSDIDTVQLAVDLCYRHKIAIPDRFIRIWREKGMNIKVPSGNDEV